MRKVSQSVRYLRSLIVCAVSLLSAEVLFAQEQISSPFFDQKLAPVSKVVKSENDAHQYRYVTLPNKLRVLLISDPTTRTSATSLVVAAGHNQDPDGREGLAHFLEHILLAGSEAYPEADAYHGFIHRHGGISRTRTTSEFTQFLFDIDSDYFEPALDRFAQSFIVPLFSQAQVERHRETVNGEYLAQAHDDSQRIKDVYRDLINPAHPLAKLDVGNLATLADHEDYPVRDDLINFYRQYYVAERMTLVMLGRESLNDLQEMASRFGKIPTGSVSAQSINLPAPSLPAKILSAQISPEQEFAEQHPSLFPSELLPLSVNVAPLGTQRQLRLIFPIAAYERDYRKKSWAFIASILGHKGEGSVLSLLRDLEWAEDLDAGLTLQTPYNAAFQISIDLTEKGVRAREQIAPLLLNTVKQLEARGIKSWRYDELKTLANINFHFSEKEAPIDSVDRLASNMQFHAALDTLRGDYLYAEFDEKQIKENLSYLRHENLLSVLIAPGVETDRYSSHYQTPYQTKKIKIEHYEIKPVIRKRLFLPEPNIFLPSRLAVKSQLILPTPTENALPKIDDRPHLIVRGERARAWFQQDRQFNVPKSSIKLRLKLPLVAVSAEGAAQAKLFAALVMDELKELSHPAEVAGLRYLVQATPRGLDIDISGYNSRQGLLLSKIAKSIHKGSFTQERFDIVKRHLMHREQNRQSPAYEILLDQISLLQSAPYWSKEELANEVERQTYERFGKFTTRFLRNGEMDMLLYGNLFRQEAIRLVALAEYELLDPGAGHRLPDAQVFQLSASEKPRLYQHAFSANNVNHRGNIVQLYVQAPGVAVEEVAHMKLLQQILKKQFADIQDVDAQSVDFTNAVPLAFYELEGMVFTLQSAAINEHQLLQKIDEFLNQQRESLTENLAENKQILTRALNEKAVSLSLQADRYWQSILLGDYKFNRDLHLAAAVSAITSESLDEYYRSIFLNSNRRLWLSSSNFSDAEAFNVVTDINVYRKQQENLIYP